MSAVVLLKYVGWQILVACGLCVISLGISGLNGAVSSGLGSIAAILPNTYFTFQAFRYKADKEPFRALAAMYRGEAGKFVLVAVFCALIFEFFTVQSPLLFFTSLVVLLISQPMISLLILPAHTEDMHVDTALATEIKESD